ARAGERAAPAQLQQLADEGIRLTGQDGGDRALAERRHRVAAGVDRLHDPADLVDASDGPAGQFVEAAIDNGALARRADARARGRWFAPCLLTFFGIGPTRTRSASATNRPLCVSKTILPAASRLALSARRRFRSKRCPGSATCPVMKIGTCSKAPGPWT